MNKRIVYTQDDGTVAVIVPADECRINSRTNCR